MLNINEEGYLYGVDRTGENWHKISVSEIFGDKITLTTVLVEMIGAYQIINLWDMELNWVENGKWEAIVADGKGKILVTTDKGVVNKIDVIALIPQEELLHSFTFSYGTADVEEVPDIDYDNANDGGDKDESDTKDYTFEEILDNMNSIKAFDENNNIKFKDYFYENSEWVLGEQRWVKGNYIYSPEFSWSNGGSSLNVWETWLILDGDKVYFGNNREGNGLSFNVFTAQEFAEEMFECDSLEEAMLMGGGVLRSVESFIKYNNEGVEYVYIGENKWQSNNVDGEIITVTVENGMVAEILFVDAVTSAPIEKKVFEYGTVELPSIPNYKA